MKFDCPSGADAVAAAISWPDWGEWFSWLGPTGTVSLAIALVLLCTVSWGLNLISLPGNWIAVALIALYAWLGPDEGRAQIGFVATGVAFGFAMLGEVIELVAGALGAQKAGASRRSTLFAMIGSMVGAIGGAFVGIPVPVIGPVIAAILFGGLGATAGAMYGEWSDGRSWRESWTIGHAAFWGRTFGALGKIMAGLAIIVITVVGVLF
ncbi:hypothetical protein Pla22_04990 [Rubripirellula amarantea]|uniref:DUF456 domain-containing protein n=1 Tax=Rubripirellula amarantea TaxID=2527999 RepID=A0A5C5WRU1_9BACT|nr:DUF456 domain-containing protein [Rubripirellula amarantea]TWT52871.1 hypothetical protein Pla22_04990 [Rubripirellula amarantea]